ncbi:hypothetical protein [Nostoc sp.]|uniref:hypothetical protein n=1 Tax=Nostoc sp. TaxID=1180 RepID=UPI002FFCA57E
MGNAYAQPNKALIMLGFVPQTPVVYNSWNPRNALAPQPTPVLVFSLNPSVLIHNQERCLRRAIRRSHY